MNVINTKTLPEECFIYENKRYLLHATFPTLPYVELKYERILKVYGIPYRKASREFYFSNPKEVLEYWNPEVFEEKELTLPLFAKMPNGSYKYCEKNHSATVPTDETIEAARETKKFVDQELINYEEILREVALYRLAKKCLKDNMYTFTHKLIENIHPIDNIEMNDDKFKILRLHCSDWIVIFDMNKVPRNGHINLQVPNQIAGAVIGKGGSNIKEWTKEIGVKKIQVIPI